MENSSRLRRMLIAITSVIASTVVPSTIPTASASVDALNDCPSGYFCVWSGTNYSGVLRAYSTTNTHLSIDLASTQSYYNRRTKRSWLHQYAGGGGSSVCINPSGRSGNTSGWQETAKGAFLASITDC